METNTAIKKLFAAKNSAASGTGAEDRSLFWRVIRIAIYFLLLSALFAFVFYSTKDLRKKFVAAEQEYDENNRFTVIDLENGAMRVKGISNGVEYEYVEDGKILQGVRVAGIDLGGMDYSQAREALLKDVEKRIADINISANVENTTRILTASDFNVSCDVNPLLQKALKVGREGEQIDFYSVYLERNKLAAEGIDLGDYELTMDEESMRAIVDEIGDVMDKAPTEPYITLLNLVGGGKTGVGIGGRTDDLATVKTVSAPDGTAIADIQFHNGQNGYMLDREDMLQQICDAFYSGDHNAELTLELTEIEPDYTAEELAASFEEISRFSTSFASGTHQRTRNVQKAAGLLHCVVMLPDEEYSYNDLLGPRYEKDGWLPASAISGGKEYIDTPGGGICQVSTTLYNSFLLLGGKVQIVRRYHHSIPGSYIDLGLDATVSYGGPDLVWKNATDTSMLLFSYADMRSRTVYSIIYGVPREDGHTFSVWSELVEEVEPPEPLIVDEPLWPRGYSKMVITPRSGYLVDVYRQEYDAEGNELGEPVKLYQDKYSAVQGELHVGTGSQSLPIPQG